MRLYLIRHCETVDNVAGLYAGIRDSAPTVHGVGQAKRLGSYFAETVLPSFAREHGGAGRGFTRIYTSKFQRAWKTAEAVRDACTEEGKSVLEVVRVDELREQDFGSLEGCKWGSSGRRDDKDDMGVETKESLDARASKFFSEHIVPLFKEEEEMVAEEQEHVVAVVSHGMLLSHLWRRLLAKLPRNSLKIAPEITAARGAVVLEHLGGWSNTGYLELQFERDAMLVKDKDLKPQSDEKASAGTSDLPKGSKDSDDAGPGLCGVPSKDNGVLSGWSTTITAINSKQHLVGLKKQRGGIGSLAHDNGQKKLDTFFTKRQKLG